MATKQEGEEKLVETGGGREPQYPTFPVLVQFKDTESSESKPGAWIRDGRAALGISQGELAKALKVHVKTIQAWEQGKTSPKSATWERLLTLLGDADRPDWPAVG